MNGELVGEWSVDARGLHTFQYDRNWLHAADARPLSLSLPLRPVDTPYRGDLVESYFGNLLPDSAEIRRRIQIRFGTASTSAFDLLGEIGRDCVGAVQLCPPGHAPENVRQIAAEALSEADVARAIRTAVSPAPLGQRENEPFRISIAGAQEKTALLWHDGRWQRPLEATPTTHIFKLPLGRVGNMQADLSTSVENEWLCAQIAREMELPVAECEIADFEDQHVLVVKRFDRKLSSDGHWWLRLPQEDFCQATGTPPGRRYESDGGPGIAPICSVLLGSRNAGVDRRNFFRAQVLFWMLCAIDGHAKNFSVFIEPHGSYSSTPLYDIVSAFPILGTGANQLAPTKAKVAMAVTGKNRHYEWANIQSRHWLSTAAAVGLAATARTDILQLAQQVPRALEAVGDRLPRTFPGQIADAIFTGLRRSADRLKQLSED